MTRTPDPNQAGSAAAEARARMVDRHLVGRGVLDTGVLRAMRTVPRERFIPADLAEFAYEDHPLPIAEGQTISQPYIVAVMAEAAQIGPQDRVLEVGAGSGYGAAVLSRIAAEVWTIERHEALAEGAHRVLDELGYDNAHVIWGDGTLGYPEAGPFDAIVVTAGGPRIPEALLEQLADGGRLVIPVGPETRGQQLIRVRRDGDTFSEEDLGAVRFVPLVGTQGWADPKPHVTAGAMPSPLSNPGAAPIVMAPSLHPRHGVSALIAEVAEPFPSITEAEVGPLLDRIGDCSVVLLGEASHGTSEFYRMRAT